MFVFHIVSHRETSSDGHFFAAFASPTQDHSDRGTSRLAQSRGFVGQDDPGPGAEFRSNSQGRLELQLGSWQMIGE